MPRLSTACVLCMSTVLTGSARPIAAKPPEPKAQQTSQQVVVATTDAEKDNAAPPKQIELRLLGGDKQEPLAGVAVLLTDGYGQEHKKFGPFLTNREGVAKVQLPLGFYTLHLQSKKEWPYLRVEKHWDKQSRGPTPALNLLVKNPGVEKWLGGKQRDAGNESPAKSDAVHRVTYNLLPACELVLRAVDIETGKGLAGVEFYEENAVGEEWAHPIDGENLGASVVPDNKPLAAEVNRTNKDGVFRRLIGANAGFKYGVELAPAGYEEVAPRREVEIEVQYGQPRAEHTFKFRRIE